MEEYRKNTRKSISRILYFGRAKTPVIYLRPTLLQGLSWLPLGIRNEPLLFWRTKNPIYLPLLRIEFTWFHYSRTVLAFCCTGPHLATDGCYPLCCSLESGLSYPLLVRESTGRNSRERQRYLFLWKNAY